MLRPPHPLVRILREGLIDEPAIPIGAWPDVGLTTPSQRCEPREKSPDRLESKPEKTFSGARTLGSKSYGNPITIRESSLSAPITKRTKTRSNTADGGVEMAFRSGHRKSRVAEVLPQARYGRVNDWPGEGLCATAYSEPGRLWYCTNTCHVVCLDLSPARPAPRRLAARHLGLRHDRLFGRVPAQHDLPARLPGTVNFVYAITGNGVDETHKHVVAPLAPCIVASTKERQGRLVRQPRPAKHILHGQMGQRRNRGSRWTAAGHRASGRRMVYAYDARTGQMVWKFDPTPRTLSIPGTQRDHRHAVHRGKYMYIANGQDPGTWRRFWPPVLR